MTEKIPDVEILKAKALEAKQKNAVWMEKGKVKSNAEPKVESSEWQTLSNLPESAQYAQGGYVPMPGEWSTVGQIDFAITPVVKEPQHGLHTIHAAYDLNKNFMQFAVETVDLETGKFTKHPVVVMSASSVESAPDMAGYIAKALAHHLGLNDLIPSFIKLLSKSVIGYIPQNTTSFWGGSIFTPEHIYKPSYPSYSSPDRLSHKLPGINATVKHPVEGTNHTLRYIIMNLNDHYKWSREKIADWLDEISDPTGVNGPDLRFKSKDDTLEQQEIPMIPKIEETQATIEFEIAEEECDEYVSAISGMTVGEFKKFQEQIKQDWKEHQDEQD